MTSLKHFAINFQIASGIYYLGLVCHVVTQAVQQEIEGRSYQIAVAIAFAVWLMSPPPLPSWRTELPKRSAASVHDSSPELPEEADPLVGDLDSSPGLPGEADPLAAADDGADGEEDNGDEADEGEEVEKEEEEKEAEGKLVENGKNEGTDSYDADENGLPFLQSFFLSPHECILICSCSLLPLSCLAFIGL